MHVTIWGFAALLAIAANLVGLGAQPKTLTFTKSDLGKVPAGWTVAKTGTGDGSAWAVVEDKTTPSNTGFALAQTAKSPSAVFNLCVLDGTTAENVELAIAFKTVEGEKDQGGGIAWRYQDSNNYYVTRFNPLEDNLRVYHVMGGKRTQIATKEGLRLKDDQWHTLGVRAFADKITCTLNGKVKVDVTDKTITKAGKVGLWTKADARTRFDRFSIAILDR